MFKLLKEKDVLMMLPEFSKVLKIYSVLPISSCEAERSFSALKRLKTYLRSKMGQNRLSSLALMHLERNIVNSVLQEDMSKLIDTFARNKKRDSYFF